LLTKHITYLASINPYLSQGGQQQRVQVTTNQLDQTPAPLSSSTPTMASGMISKRPMMTTAAGVIVPGSGDNKVVTSDFEMWELDSACPNSAKPSIPATGSDEKSQDTIHNYAKTVALAINTTKGPLVRTFLRFQGTNHDCGKNICKLAEV
jgi:hypothetical protein